MLHAQTHPCTYVQITQSQVSTNVHSVVVTSSSLPIQTCPLHWYTGESTYLQSLMTILGMWWCLESVRCTSAGLDVWGVAMFKLHMYTTSCNTSEKHYWMVCVEAHTYIVMSIVNSWACNNIIMLMIFAGRFNPKVDSKVNSKVGPKVCQLLSSWYAFNMLDLQVVLYMASGWFQRLQS